MNCLKGMLELVLLTFRCAHLLLSSPEDNVMQIILLVGYTSCGGLVVCADCMVRSKSKATLFILKHVYVEGVCR